MLLREKLEEYTREELLDHARSFELRKCSNLRKAQLIEELLLVFAQKKWFEAD